MPRLLWLAFAAAVAALAFAVLLGWLFPKPIPARWTRGINRSTIQTPHVCGYCHGIHEPEPADAIQADDYPWRVLARGAA